MIPKTRKDARGRRSGQILILSPVFVIALAGICALAVDVGYVAVQQARLQNAADAAALAGAQTLLAARADGWDEECARAIAEEEAIAIHEANCPGAARQIIFGLRQEDGSFAPAGIGDVADAVRVVGYRSDDAPSGPVDTVFASVLGVQECDVKALAGVAVEGDVRGVRVGLSPFAVPEDRIVPPGEHMTFYPAGDDEAESHGRGHGQTAEGNWGLLDLDRGSNGVPDLRDWILNGYNGEFDLGEDGYLWVDGNPGFRAALQSEISARIGDQLIMVVYDEVTGNGANCQYHCIGFLLSTITSCDLTGNDAHATCRVDQVSNVPNLIFGGSYESPNIRRVRLAE
jgi:hypothetical protein